MKIVSFGKKMNSFYIISLLIPLIVISAFSMNYSKWFLVKQVKSNNDQIVNNIKVGIENFFIEPQNEMDLIHESIVNNTIDLKNLDKIFSIKRSNFDHIIVVDKNDQVEFSYPNNKVGFDYSKKETVLKIRSGEKNWWSKTYVDLLDEKIAIDYSLPLGDKILIGSIHLERLYAAFNSIVSKSDYRIGITDASGVYILHSTHNYVDQRQTDPYVNEKKLDFELVNYENQKFYGKTVESIYQNWHIVTYVDYLPIKKQITEFTLILSSLVFILGLIVMVLGNRLNKLFTNNLSEIVKRTKSIASGFYDIGAKECKILEFNDISHNYVQMANNIQERENKIREQSEEIKEMNQVLEVRVEERTAEIEAMLDNLKNTQEQLVESEKLASLSNLVAGLAHEINTPLGVIVTVITFLQENTRKVNDQFNCGLLKKSEFEAFLKKSMESEKIIYDNINRANELISSFKLISTEQRDSDIKVINIGDYIDIIIKSLKPQMDRHQIEIILNCDANIEIRTIPISIYQIIVNLTINAKIHAYDKQAGIIEISVVDKNEEIMIIIEDYGKGIPDADIKKIFEPFFTTKRGKGGTGLGLNITYNTIKQNLNGKIHCISKLGKGTKFTIILPRFLN